MTSSITVEGRTLADALKPLLFVVERRNTIPILSYVRLSVVGSELHLTGTDLDIVISNVVDMIDASGKFDICLPSKILHDICALAGPSPVKFTIGTRVDSRGDKPFTLDIVSVDVADGDAVYTIDSPLPASDFPDFKQVEYKHIETFTNGRLSELLEKVSPCISTEETRYYLNGVAWQYRDGACRFTTTDGHRLASARYGKTDDENASMSVIIPRKTVQLLQSFGRGKDVVVAGGSSEKEDYRFLSFTYGCIRVLSKTIDGTFPDWRRVVPTDNKAIIEFDREQLRNALGKVTAIASERGRAVRIFADNDGSARLSVRNSDCGEATARTFAKWPAGTNTTEFGFNASYLKQAVGKGSGAFRMRFEDAGSPFLIEDNDEEMTRVLMPMRI